MVQVPNPFKVIDEVILDYIFNPLTWWTEYRFRINPSSIGTFCVISGSVMAIVSLMILNQIVLGTLAGLMCGLSLRKRVYARRLWIRNNATGKNVMREAQWVTRISMLFFTVIITAYMLVALAAGLESEVSLNLNPNYLWYMFILGMWFINVITAYLDATDAMPPWYREFKSVPQT